MTIVFFIPIIIMNKSSEQKQTLEQSRLIQAKYEQKITSFAPSPSASSMRDPREGRDSGGASASPSQNQIPSTQNVVGTASTQDQELITPLRSTLSSRSEIKQTISKLYAKRDLPPSSSSQLPGISESEAREPEEPVDVRIEREILKLNEAAAVTNKLQVELQDLEAKSASAVGILSEDLARLERKLGRCIQDAEPYFEAKREEKQAEAIAQQASFAYTRAKARLLFYKEQASKLENDLIHQGGTVQLGPLSLLNALTSNVIECQQEVRAKERDHSDAMDNLRILTENIKDMEKTLKAAIKESRPYYKMRDKLTYMQNEDTLRADQLKITISSAKDQYATATETLGVISKEIHDSRQANSDGSSTENEEPASPSLEDASDLT